ncbi:flotillin domain-containing protein, partial [Novosphingopyxis sp. YJ-S2-01]|uniref:flotillin domain-containing protein n=1 Tax=Novosphingopyxis sp. YJ-S2-01 TaxID=2794021 RepID=UPI001A303228|nr:flotillin family protein [Novosphingopyxis sp. YJ-S2-01]
ADSGAPAGKGAGNGSGNLATDAVSAALAYRAQAPVLDGLMNELGLDGSSLGALVQGAAKETEDASPPAAPIELPEKPRASGSDGSGDELEQAAE